LVFGDDTKILGSGIVREGVNVLGAKITTYQLIIIAVSVILIAALWWVMKKTRLGKSMRAVANDPELATVSGIDTDRVILWAFGVGSGLAAVAGLLVALDVGMTPTMGLNALMLAVVAVIIGGVGSITGMAMGAFLLAAAQQFAAWQFGSQWQDALAFAILLVFLLIRPQGFLGRKPKKATL
jgi:branched-chain amino acid transport system permease protein